MKLIEQKKTEAKLRFIMQTRSECCGKLAKSLYKPVQITYPCKALGAQCENVGVAGNR